ncbi:IclR family transcriptional regulator [Glutamicibacter sp. BW80]|uniref:IclR family transcriptional regulator n=1 Tax=Glutamicibacter sp. BW80 TaxID=2024404 RepID=UPI001596C622|nr:IclR family transcriptional regulator [Glutamicibacter sp. BW80]
MTVVEGLPNPSSVPPVREPKETSIIRALQLLDVFMGDRTVWGVTDIARQAGLPTSTTHRLLSHLVDGEVVTKDGPDYSLSGRLFELGYQLEFTRPQGLRDVSGPFLGELFATTGLTVHLAVLDRAQLLLVNKISGLHTYQSKYHVGARYTATCTALGKSMLAFEDETETRRIIAQGLPRRTRHSLTRPADFLVALAEIRKTRLAFNREESYLGEFCVATPVLRFGKAIAALSLSGSPAQLESPQTHGLLIRIANDLSQILDRQVQLK